MNRVKLIELCKQHYNCDKCGFVEYCEKDCKTLDGIKGLADHLIANGIGDITAEKHRADVTEEALRELIAEMYENGIRPICNQEMLYETRLEQAEARLKERK